MGPDGGGGPPIQETGATAPELKSAQTKEQVFNPALLERRQKILNVLNDERLVGYGEEGTRVVKQEWLGKMKENLDPAIVKALSEGRKDAEVIQFADATTDLSYPQGRFAALYFSAFGTHAGNDFKVSPQNIGEVIKDPKVTKVYKKEGEEIPDTEGTAVVLDSEGNPLYLIVETDIPGVRLMLDGPGVTMADDRGDQIRPMLLVRVDDAGTDAIIEAETDENYTLQKAIEDLKKQNQGEVTEEEAEAGVSELVTHINTVEDPKKRKALLGVLATVLLGLGKEFVTGSGITKIPQQGR